ncbi:paired domain-containing protein [Trichonephila clavipes]|nr:paired domain-containing protein [Trichonephila clavipes]
MIITWERMRLSFFCKRRIDWKLSSSEIVLLRLAYLGPNSDAICLFKELGNDGRRQRSGRKRSVNTSRNRKAIEKQIQIYPRVSMRQIVCDLEISNSSVRLIAKKELGLKPTNLRKI